MSRPWTYPELREAAWRIAAGEEVASVAAHLGRSRRAVRAALERHGEWGWGELVRAGRHNRRAPVVAAYLRSDLSLEEAAAHVGLSEKAFINFIRRQGLRGKQTRRPWRSHQHREAVARRCYVLRQNGLLYREIADAVGVPTQSVSRLVRRYAARMESWRGSPT